LSIRGSYMETTNEFKRTLFILLGLIIMFFIDTAVLYIIHNSLLQAVCIIIVAMLYSGYISLCFKFEARNNVKKG
jgi:hypothetical protein